MQLRCLPISARQMAFQVALVDNSRPAISSRNVVHDCRHHRLNHVACFGRSGRARLSLPPAEWRYSHPPNRYSDRWDCAGGCRPVRNLAGCRALPLSPLHPPPEGRQHHTEPECKLMLFVQVSGAVILLDMHLSDSTLVTFALVIQLTWWARISDSRKPLSHRHRQTEVPDGAPSDKGHGHFVAHFPFTQVGIHDEGKFIGRPKATAKSHR